jgi:peptide/nickel transport system permease protein
LRQPEKDPSHQRADEPVVPRSLINRMFYPMIQNRRTLAGVLSWIGLGLLVSFVVIAILAPVISPYPVEGPPSLFLTPPNQAPSLAHWMGTDSLGRDVFSRVLWGARTSLEVMIIGVVFALVVGFPIGLFSGYVGGLVDKIILLFMDSVYAFPGLLLAALVAAMLGKGVLNIGLAITVIYIPLYYRVTRNQTLSVREETYVEAAKSLGATRWTIMWSYIAYNVLITIPVIFALSAADAILTAAGLSYLGLGIERPTPDWGLDLSDAQQFLGVGVWWTSLFPGLMIVLLTVGLSFFGEGLNDLINPLLRKKGT